MAKELVSIEKRTEQQQDAVVAMRTPIEGGLNLSAVEHQERQKELSCCSAYLFGDDEPTNHNNSSDLTACVFL